MSENVLHKLASPAAAPLHSFFPAAGMSSDLTFLISCLREGGLPYRCATTVSKAPPNEQEETILQFPRGTRKTLMLILLHHLRLFTHTPQHLYKLLVRKDTVATKRSVVIKEALRHGWSDVLAHAVRVREHNVERIRVAPTDMASIRRASEFGVDVRRLKQWVEEHGVDGIDAIFGQHREATPMLKKDAMIILTWPHVQEHFHDKSDLIKAFFTQHADRIRFKIFDFVRELNRTSACMADTMFRLHQARPMLDTVLPRDWHGESPYTLCGMCIRPVADRERMLYLSKSLDACQGSLKHLDVTPRDLRVTSVTSKYPGGAGDIMPFLRDEFRSGSSAECRYGSNFVSDFEACVQFPKDNGNERNGLADMAPLEWTLAKLVIFATNDSHVCEHEHHISKFLENVFNEHTKEERPSPQEVAFNLICAPFILIHQTAPESLTQTTLERFTNQLCATLAVCDDGSTDGPTEWAQGVAAKIFSASLLNQLTARWQQENGHHLIWDDMVDMLRSMVLAMGVDEDKVREIEVFIAFLALENSKADINGKAERLLQHTVPLLDADKLVRWFVRRHLFLCTGEQLRVLKPHLFCHVVQNFFRCFALRDPLVGHVDAVTRATIKNAVAIRLAVYKTQNHRLFMRQVVKVQTGLVCAIGVEFGVFSDAQELIRSANEAVPRVRRAMMERNTRRERERRMRERVDPIVDLDLDQYGLMASLADDRSAGP